MTEFLHGWRRKLGVLTLLMACVFAAGWVRTFARTDGVDFKKFQFISSHQSIILARETGAGSTDKKMEFWSFPSFKSGPNDLSEWKWRCMGVAFQEYVTGMRIRKGDDSTRVVTKFRLPYSIVIFPLTMLSTYLFLINPRPKANSLR